jgi:hypothetical protein
MRLVINNLSVSPTTSPLLVQSFKVISEKYKRKGREKVGRHFFPRPTTHTI